MLFMRIACRMRIVSSMRRGNGIVSSCTINESSRRNVASSNSAVSFLEVAMVKMSRYN